MPDPTDDDIKESVQMAYPDRPGEPDCVYYLKTGMCGYGDDCKFNHPTNNVQDDQNGGQLPERVGEPDCAYFLKTGTCKYGSLCKYDHPRDRHGAGPVVLNKIGMPMRQDQESCSHYLRTGWCKFGVACKFHHPQPKLDGPNPPVSGTLPYAPVGASTRISGGLGWPYLSPQTYFPVLLPSSGCNPGWSSSPYMGNMSPVLSTNGLTSVDHIYPLTPSSDPPVRPGEPECRYFMNNGTCKYGSDCKYHHPREKMVKADAGSFGQFGLPLRPGQPMCSFYMLYGICKYGMGCKYDHPFMAYSYNYINGLTYLPMVDPSPSKPLKNTCWTSEQLGNLKFGTVDSSGDQVGSSHSSSQNQSD